MIKYYLIYGSRDSGKTRIIKQLAELYKQNNLSLGGIYSEAVLFESVKTSYQIHDIKTSNLYNLCEFDSDADVGNYRFDNEVVNIGNDILIKSLRSNLITIVDEVGPLEINGKGWHKALISLQNIRILDKKLIITLRQGLVDQFIVKYNVIDYKLYSTDWNLIDIHNSILSDD